MGRAASGTLACGQHCLAWQAVPTEGWEGIFGLALPSMGPGSQAPANNTQCRIPDPLENRSVFILRGKMQ